MMSDVCLHCFHSTRAIVNFIYVFYTFHIQEIRKCHFGPDADRFGNWARFGKFTDPLKSIRLMSKAVSMKVKLNEESKKL